MCGVWWVVLRVLWIWWFTLDSLQFADISLLKISRSRRSAQSLYKTIPKRYPKITIPPPGSGFTHGPQGAGATDAPAAEAAAEAEARTQNLWTLCGLHTRLTTRPIELLWCYEAQTQNPWTLSDLHTRLTARPIELLWCYKARTQNPWTLSDLPTPVATSPMKLISCLRKVEDAPHEKRKTIGLMMKNWCREQFLDTCWKRYPCEMS